MTLYRINWGDDDNFYVMAKSMKEVLDGFPEDKGLINYVVKMDETYKMVYNAGFNDGYDAGLADSEQWGL